MVSNLALRQCPLAIRHDPRLLSDVGKTADNLLVPIVKAVNGIRNSNLFAKLHDVLLRGAEVVSRDAWVEMVDGLRDKLCVSGAVHT